MKVSNEIRWPVAWLVSLTILSVFHDPAAAGLVNVSSPCLFAGPDADCSQYLLWDTVHPTTAGHAIFAERVRETVCGTDPVHPGRRGPHAAQPLAVWRGVCYGTK